MPGRKKIVCQIVLERSSVSSCQDLACDSMSDKEGAPLPVMASRLSANKTAIPAKGRATANSDFLAQLEDRGCLFMAFRKSIRWVGPHPVQMKEPIPHGGSS